MKPCGKYRKWIAWQVVDALDGPQAHHLKTHLESCPGCRTYLQELAQVTRGLNSVEVRHDASTSEQFHRRVNRALMAQPSRPAGWSLTGFFRSPGLFWRAALPAFTALGLILLLAHPTTRPLPPVLPANPSTAQPAVTQNSRPLAPTLANYQRVANRSLEDLDTLLNAQGNRIPAAPQLYTASMWRRGIVSVNY